MHGDPPAEWIKPDWPAPPHVRALITTCHGGVSIGPYAGPDGTGGLNLGLHCGDDPAAVATNRARLRACLPAEPVWMNQVHGVRVIEAASYRGLPPEQADAAWTREPGCVCVVMMADCMPILLCDRDGTTVAIAHAGWRGLSGGVVEAAVGAMRCAPAHLMAWLGPAIGPARFEVGEDVMQAFTDRDPAARAGFHSNTTGKWLADLEWLARRRLEDLGVREIGGGGRCTVTEARSFYSYRRDRITGRMAALIWIEK